jgi:uncharacterized protein (TIGR02611 family)
MKFIKKSCISIVGSLLVLLGLVFIIVPGPSMLLIILGLFILSYEYPAAKLHLRKCMRLVRRSAQWLDQKLLHRKYN